MQNVFVPFFGRPAATPRAAADLVLRTGALALVCFNYKRADGTYRASSEEVEVPRTGDTERDAVELTARSPPASRRPSAPTPSSGSGCTSDGRPKRARPLRVSLRVALPALLLVAACGVPPKDDGPAPPEVTLHDVRLRSYRGSSLTAVGRSQSMAYERASADVVSGPGRLDVLSHQAPSLAGRLPPATLIETKAARANLLTHGVDVWGGVTLQTPTGLEGRTATPTSTRRRCTPAAPTRSRCRGRVATGSGRRRSTSTSGRTSTSSTRCRAG